MPALILQTHDNVQQQVLLYLLPANGQAPALVPYVVDWQDSPNYM